MTTSARHAQTQTHTHTYTHAKKVSTLLFLLLPFVSGMDHVAASAAWAYERLLSSAEPVLQHGSREEARRFESCHSMIFVVWFESVPQNRTYPIT